MFIFIEFMKKCRRPLCLDQSLLTSRTNKTMSQRDLEIFQLDEQVFEAEFDDKEDWNDFFSIFKYVRDNYYSLHNRFTD